MPDPATALAKLCTKTDPGEFSFTLTRSEVISRVIALGLVDNAEAAKEMLERGQDDLIHTVFVDGWAIHYNVYTDKYLFNRLLPPELLTRVAELHSKNIERSLADALRRLTARQFELFIGNLLNRLPGYRSVSVTKATRDGGVDFTALLGGPGELDTHVVGQAKHWMSHVSAPEVHKLIGVIAIEAKGGVPVRGMMIALSGLTAPADDVLRDSPFMIDKLELTDLISLMLENGVGTQRFTVNGVVADPSFWEELYGL